MKITDLEDNVNLDFNVGAMKLDIDSHLIEKLRDLGLSYKLN